MKVELTRLKALRREQTSRLKTGSQKAFFTRVWARLHGTPVPALLTSPVKVHYSNDVCVRTGEGCTDVRVSLEKYKNGSYCRMCYRKQSSDMSCEAQRKLCKQSTMGCASCKEPICKSCWKDGYDRHKEE